MSTGKVKDRMELYDLYQKPGDRDASRDYHEGQCQFGSAPPEGIVYFEEVLGYYLAAPPRGAADWRSRNRTNRWARSWRAHRRKRNEPT